MDRGYKGHGVEDDPLRNHTKIFISIFISDQRKGLTKSIKKQLKSRSAIEPMIGHMKQKGKLGLKLGLCRLKGIIGDQINAILTGAGHNLRLILNHIRKLLKLEKLGKFLAQILLRLLEIFLPKTYQFRKC